jgi:hypothetical protein
VKHLYVEFTNTTPRLPPTKHIHSVKVSKRALWTHGGKWELGVFEDRVLRRIFGPKRDELVGGWRNLHDEELHNLYSSPNIIRVTKSRRIKWAEHVASMGIRRIHIGFWWECEKEIDH